MLPFVGGSAKIYVLLNLPDAAGIFRRFFGEQVLMERMLSMHRHVAATATGFFFGNSGLCAFRNRYQSSMRECNERA